MSTLHKEEKRSLKTKLREFKLQGLISYATYLAHQLEQSEGNESRKSYANYVKKEIKSTAKKIAKLERKLAPQN